MTNEAIKTAIDNHTPLMTTTGELVTAYEILKDGRVAVKLDSGLVSLEKASELRDPAAGNSEYSSAVRWLQGSPEARREREAADIADAVIRGEMRRARILGA